MSDLILNLSGARIRRTDLSNANLTGANLSHADASFVIFRGANFKDAILMGTILKGADLSGASNLTWDQLSEAIIDDTTILPDYLVKPRKSA